MGEIKDNGNIKLCLNLEVGDKLLMNILQKMLVKSVLKI